MEGVVRSRVGIRVLLSGGIGWAKCCGGDRGLGRIFVSSWSLAYYWRGCRGEQGLDNLVSVILFILTFLDWSM